MVQSSPLNGNLLERVAYMPKKTRKPRLRPLSPQPHIEVKDQTGTLLPINEYYFEEDAEGIFLNRVEVQLPVGSITYNKSYVTSGHHYNGL